MTGIGCFSAIPGFGSNAGSLALACLRSATSSHSIEPFDFTQSRHSVGLYNHSPIRLEAGGHRLPLPRNSGRNPSEASVAGTLRNDRHYGHRSGCQNHQTGNGSPHEFAS
jgi:hypothetical protein